MSISLFEAIVRGRNCQYLGSWAKNQKNKGTLFSSTLKVEEKKVLSDFRLGAIWLRYGHFDVFLHIFDIF